MSVAFRGKICNCLSPLGTLILVTLWSLEVLRVSLFSEVTIIFNGIISWGRVTWSLFGGWLLLGGIVGFTVSFTVSTTAKLNGMDKPFKLLKRATMDKLPVNWQEFYTFRLTTFVVLEA